LDGLAHFLRNQSANQLQFLTRQAPLIDMLVSILADKRRALDLERERKVPMITYTPTSQSECP
jgi:hypothetical protein